MKNEITKVIHRRIISSGKIFPPKKQTTLDSLFFLFFSKLNFHLPKLIWLYFYPSTIISGNTFGSCAVPNIS